VHDLPHFIKVTLLWVTALRLRGETKVTRQKKGWADYLKVYLLLRVSASCKNCVDFNGFPFLFSIPSPASQP